MKSKQARILDQTARRYGTTPSKLIGLTDHKNNPNYYGLQLDMAMAVRYELDDEDLIDNRLLQLKQVISKTAFNKVKWGNALKPEDRRIDKIKKEHYKNKPLEANQIPSQEELLAKWNIK